ncbi:MAG: hypothetical protein EA422_10625 [Gemmatimonadales bacterium]|nr:MAG: hypothetical protein EA422_10625 [Gemmatimonadales bacterium]
MILYDDEALYVGARLHESDRSRSTLLTLERDFPGASTRDSDIFAITLDTFLDRRNSFIFLVNPRGALRDGQTFDDSRNQDFAWRGAVEVETVQFDWGWTLEMAIPWSALRFDPTLDELSFGMNLLRRVRWKNEDSYWAPVDRHDPVHRMSRAGTLTGIQGVSGGRNVRLKPFAGAGHSAGAAVGEADLGGQWKAGGDLKVGLTPQLTLDLTLNTDFSQVEVDQQQVNLTRFSLFFPEQREFFVENSGSFTFGDVTERGYRTGSSLRQFTLFHSRRIGMTPAGQPLPILGGGRLSGRVGDTELGFLNMQTRSARGLPAENFAVARVRRPLGNAGDVGFLFVNRQPTGWDGAAGRDGAPGGDGVGTGPDGVDPGEAANRSFGVDANFRLLGNLIVNAYAAGVQDPQLSGDRFAGRVAAAWRDRMVNTSAFVRHVGHDFDPGVGFVRRPGVRHHYGTFGLHPRPGWALVQEVNPYVEFDYVTATGPRVTATGSGPDAVLGRSDLVTRNRKVGLDVEFSDGSELSLQADDRYEILDVPFRVSGGARVAPGRYRFREVGVGYESSRARAFSARVNVDGGGFFDGDRISTRFQGRWRPSAHLSVDGIVDHNRISLPEVGSFTADVVGTRIRYAHSTRLFASSFVQYNAAADEIVTSLRLNYIHAPLSDFYVTFTERRSREGVGPEERVLAIKLTRTLAL